jgi:1-aminocyclopropane-1-carboxylate deaminase/D-cysteine desulfhydrase-like pyridoxal-dependent ACC family enzyme
LLAAAQILIENGLQPIPFVKESHHWGTNARLLEILVEKGKWVVLDGNQWKERQEWRAQHLDRLEGLGMRPFFVEEGAFMQEALWGSTLLADELMAQFEELGMEFQHIFIDAGTCLSAFGLALGLSALGWEGRLHVVSMAAKEEEFESRWQAVRTWLNPDQGRFADKARSMIRFCRPANGASFGAITAATKEAILKYAQRFGVLSDPIYSAKLLQTAEILGNELSPEQKVLIIHSGGTGTLPGFLPL